MPARDAALLLEGELRSRFANAQKTRDGSDYNLGYHDALGELLEWHQDGLAAPSETTKKCLCGRAIPCAVHPIPPTEPETGAVDMAKLETAVASYGSACYLADADEMMPDYRPLWKQIHTALAAAHAASDEELAILDDLESLLAAPETGAVPPLVRSMVEWANAMQTLTPDDRASVDAWLKATASGAAMPCADCAEHDALVSKLSDLLTRTANAIKGEPDELTWHNWADLPEAATNALAAAHAAGRREREGEIVAASVDEDYPWETPLAVQHAVNAYHMHGDAVRLNALDKAIREAIAAARQSERKEVVDSLRFDVKTLRNMSMDSEAEVLETIITTLNTEPR